MSRSTNFIGLHPQAREWIDKNVNKITSNWNCPNCGHSILSNTNLETIEEDRFTTGMFDEKISLKTYRTKDGEIVREEVQDEVWSSGPCIFTHLTINNIPVSYCSWTSDEIDKYLGDGEITEGWE